jgi:hypothetical protein
VALGSPTIIGPVTPCCDQVRIRGQFTGSNVRIFIGNDPVPVGELKNIPWSDYVIPVNRSRLAANKILTATQEFGGQTSPKSPKGVTIDPATFGTVTFVKPPYVCGRSVLLSVQADPKLGAAAGSRIEIWQGTNRLGAGVTVGTLCRVDFDANERIIAGLPLTAVQFICSTPSPQTTTSGTPLTPPTVPIRKMPKVQLVHSEDGVNLLEECGRLIKVRNIVPGAVLRLLREGAEIFNGPVPTDQEAVFMGSGFGPHEKIAAEQSMIFCEFRPSDLDEGSTDPLQQLRRPRIEGPMCDGPAIVQVSGLKPGATLVLFADGVEIGRWEASDVSMPVSLNVPSPPATITAQQTACGHTSPLSRGYTAATKGSGRWFVVEDASGNDLKADAFAVHAAMTHGSQIVLFSGDQHNAFQNQAKPQDIDHCQLFDCQALALQKIDAPTTDVFCSGHALRPDGRLVVAGGTERFPLPLGDPDFHHDHFPGLRDTWLFEPSAPSGSKYWAKTASMRGGRWYPTLVTLQDGHVLALSGHPEEADSHRHNNNTMELFDSAAGWTTLGDSPSITTSAPGPGSPGYLYPRLHVIPGGDVFSSTPLLSGRSGRWSPSSGGTTWKDVSPAPANYGDYNHTSVLLPFLPEDGYRAMVAITGDKDSFVIDFGTPAAPNPSPSWVSLGGRSPTAAGRVRLNCSAVILPTSEVLVLGGLQNPADDNTKVLDPEVLQHVGPGIWKWSSAKLAAATVVRNYHSTALLMPDGRVWTAGGNVNASPGGTNVRHLEIEIYEPWYFCSERPVLHAWPTVVHAGQRMMVRVWSKNPITRLALIRAGSATHSFNPDQRYVGLDHLVHESNDLYIAQVPPSDIAIPGYYMLFACTDKNVPSVGVFLQILA